MEEAKESPSDRQGSEPVKNVTKGRTVHLHFTLACDVYKPKCVILRYNIMHGMQLRQY